MVAKTDRNGKSKTKIYAPKRLSLACGQHKPEGYFGIDLQPAEGVDLVYDLFNFPWPIKDSSVEALEASHFIEHLPHWRPGWERDGWFLFFDEVYRICKKDAECIFVHPYCKNGRAFWDPTHERFIHETTWAYLSRAWREQEKLDHYPAEHDFEVVAVDGTGIPDTVQIKHHEAQQFMRTHYWDVIADLVVRLRVLK